MKEININFDSKTNIELLHECGEREDAAMSQHAVTKELDKLGKKIDDLGQKIDDGEISEVDTSALILEKGGNKITIDPTGNHGTLSTPSVRSHGEEERGLGMMERHGFVLQEDFIGLVSRNGDKVGIFWDENNGCCHSYFIGVDRGRSGRHGFYVHGQGGDDGVTVSRGKFWVNNDFSDPTDIDGGEAATVDYVRSVVDPNKIFNTLASFGVLSCRTLSLVGRLGDKPEIIRAVSMYGPKSGDIDPCNLPAFDLDLYIEPLFYNDQYVCDAIIDGQSQKLIPLGADFLVNLPELGDCLFASQTKNSCVNFFSVHFTAGDYNELEFDFDVPFEDGMTWIDWVHSIYPRLNEYGLAEWEYCNVYYDKSSVYIGFQYAGWSGTEIVKDIYELVQCESFDMGEWA